MESMFDECLKECRHLAGEASEQLKQLQEASEVDRKGLSAAVVNLLRQADDNLQTLQQEARSAPASQRQKLAQEEKTLRDELRAISKELEQVRRDLLLGKDEGGKTDKLFIGKDERGRMTNVTDSLSKGNARLKEANKMALEAETVGVEALQELRRQREVMCRVKDNTADLGANLQSSDATLKSLEAPTCVTM